MDATNPPEQSAPIRLPDVSGEKHKEVIEKLFAAKLQREAAEQRFIKVRAENDDLQEELGQLQAQYDVLKAKYDTDRPFVRVSSGRVTGPKYPNYRDRDGEWEPVFRKGAATAAIIGSMVGITLTWFAIWIFDLL